MVIFDYTILLRPFGGKICLRQTAASSGYKKASFFISLLLAVRDFALMSLNWINHETKTYNRNYLGILVFLLAGITIYNICGASPVSAADESLSVSISGNPTVNIAPSSEGTFADSGNVTIGVTTTNATGYNLSISAQDSTNLKGKNDNTQIISTLESAISPSDFSTSATYNNKWGYKPSQYYNTSTQTVIQNTNYLPSPTTSGNTLDVTSAAGSKNYTMSIGARITNATKFDEYSNTFVVTAIANVVPLTVVFDANGGSFSGGETTNTMGVKMNCTGEPPETVTKYAHTPNVSDAGIASTTYSNNMDTTNTVTIDGADTLNVTVYYDAESTSYDWVSVYQSPFSISTSNDATVSTSTGNLSGKLSGRNSNRTSNYTTWYSKTYTVTGDTVKFHFRSDGSSTYYGYYAVVTGTVEGPKICNNTVTSGTYKKPTSDSGNFIGWATSSTSTTPVYGPDVDLTTEYLGENDSTTILYAVYVYYMQNVDKIKTQLADKAVGTELEVVDKRDNKEYKVAKLADGKIWLLDNLAFDPTATGTTMTESDTNAPAAAINVFLNGGSSGQSGWTSTKVANSSTFTTYNTPIINTGYVNAVPSDATSQAGQYKIGVYYNYCAATAGTYCYAGGSGTGNAQYDICPANWRMPTGITGEYYTLLNNYGYAKLRAALHLPLSGYYFSGSALAQGNEGIFWSSTRGNESGMYRLGLNTSSVFFEYASDRYYGLSVRCVAK